MEYEIEWWKDWLEGDILKRQELVEGLPFIKGLPDLVKLEDSNVIKHVASNMLNSFFEDLENALYTKIEGEKNERHSKNTEGSG